MSETFFPYYQDGMRNFNWNPAYQLGSDTYEITVVEYTTTATYFILFAETYRTSGSSLDGFLWDNYNFTINGVAPNRFRHDALNRVGDYFHSPFPLYGGYNPTNAPITFRISTRYDSSGENLADPYFARVEVRESNTFTPITNTAEKRKTRLKELIGEFLIYAQSRPFSESGLHLGRALELYVLYPEPKLLEWMVDSVKQTDIFKSGGGIATGGGWWGLVWRYYIEVYYLFQLCGDIELLGIIESYATSLVSQWTENGQPDYLMNGDWYFTYQESVPNHVGHQFLLLSLLWKDPQSVFFNSDIIRTNVSTAVDQIIHDADFVFENDYYYQKDKNTVGYDLMMYAQYIPILKTGICASNVYNRLWPKFMESFKRFADGPDTEPYYMPDDTAGGFNDSPSLLQVYKGMEDAIATGFQSSYGFVPVLKTTLDPVVVDVALTCGFSPARADSGILSAGIGNDIDVKTAIGGVPDYDGTPIFSVQGIRISTLLELHFNSWESPYIFTANPPFYYKYRSIYTFTLLPEAGQILNFITTGNDSDSVVITMLNNIGQEELRTFTGVALEIDDITYWVDSEGIERWIDAEGAEHYLVNGIEHVVGQAFPAQGSYPVGTQVTITPPLGMRVRYKIT